VSENKLEGYIHGFSTWGKRKKIEWLSSISGISVSQLESYSWHGKEEAHIFDSLSENTISHFVLPFGIAPNFKINEKKYVLPIVTEESSMVAAIAKAAKVWFSRGGFKARVLSTVKKGQVHFFWECDYSELKTLFPELKESLLKEIYPLAKKMEERGGGISNICILDKTRHLKYYFQLDVDFETGDAMGANFINSVLEKMAEILQEFLSKRFPDILPPEINMAILSNYTPECLVEAFVECPVEKLEGIINGMSAIDFADKFEKAILISRIDVSRAVTHNKGILNGIDSLALATGNDWRAIEADVHAYAS